MDNSEVIEFYKNVLLSNNQLLDWKSISQRNDLPNSIEFFETFKNYLDWDSVYIFSEERIWTEEFLYHFRDFIDWDKLSNWINPKALTKVLLIQFKNYWNWKNISSRSKIKIPQEMIIEFKYKIRWDWFQIENAIRYPYPNHEVLESIWYKLIVWNKHLIHKVQDTISFELLCTLENVEWDEDLLDEYVFKFDSISNCWTNLSCNRSLPWSKKLIKKYKEKWKWNYLSANQSLPWSEELIIQFEDYWHFRPKRYDLYSESLNENDSLASNSKIHWSNSLLERYKDKLCFFRIALHGEIDSKIVIKFYQEFDQEFECGCLSTRTSDFVSDYEVIKTGWECLVQNPLFKFCEEDRYFFEEHDTFIFFITNNEKGMNGETIIPQIGYHSKKSTLGRWGNNEKKKVKVIDIFSKKYHDNPELLLE